MPTLPTDRLAQMVAAKRAEAGLPGVAVGIVADDGLAWFTGQGWADLDTREAPTDRHLGRVASVTKTFTSTSILQLRDRGLLTLDDHLAQHIPEFTAVRERGGRRDDVTIRRLLTHRSGLVTESPPTMWDGPHGPDFPTLDLILAALRETSIVIPADSAFKYSNLAFALLGEVVTRLSGRPFAEHVRTEILEPLGMTATAFEIAELPGMPRMIGYSPGESADRPTPAPTASLKGLSSAGQLMTNVADLAEWVAFQLRGTGQTRDGRRILSQESHDDAFRPLTVEPDFTWGQCLTWRVNRVGDHVFHNHGGSVHGFNTSVSFHRPSRTGAIVLTNVWPTTAAAELAFALLDVAIGGPDARTWPAPPAEPPTAPPDAIRPLLGRYRAEPGISMEFVWRDGGLRFVAPPGTFPLHVPALVEAIPARDGAFRVLTGRAAGEDFTVLDDDGTAWFTLGGFRYTRG